MIVLFSVFASLYMAKMNKYMGLLQFYFKTKFNTKRAKPFDCTACLSFWTSLTVCLCYGLTWDAYLLNGIAAFGAGSFIEKVYYRL